MFLNRNLFKYQNQGLLFLRLTMGALMAIHGLMKIMGGAKLLTAIGSAIAVFGINDNFYYFGLLAALCELIGGVLVFLGLFTRIGCILVMGSLGVATFTTLPNGFMAYSKPLEDLVMFIALFIAGPGAYSIDRSLFGKR